MIRSKFPGGELHITLTPAERTQYVQRADLWSSDDIMEMLLWNNALKHCGYTFRWLIPYVPYARQDRACNPGEALSIQVMANLINSLNAEEVVIWDPHSDVTPALINNVTILQQHKLVSMMVGDRSYSAVIAPDAGAAKKALKVAQVLETSLVHAHKVRDNLTGKIERTILLDPLPEDESLPLLVIDDICDGGRTSVELGKLLKGRKADLYVTHGIFSNGVEQLFDYYDRIFCANIRNPNLATHDSRINVLGGLDD